MGCRYKWSAALPQQLPGSSKFHEAIGLQDFGVFCFFSPALNKQFCSIRAYSVWQKWHLFQACFKLLWVQNFTLISPFFFFLLFFVAAECNLRVASRTPLFSPAEVKLFCRRCQFCILVTPQWEEEMW